MLRANMLVRLSPALNNCLTRNIKFYKAPSAICASLLLQSRGMGSHGPPANWKSLKQIALETKSHMDFLPVPEGSWHESYSKKQKKANLLLAASALAFGLTYYIVYKSGCIYLHGYDYKTFKSSAGLSGPSVVASFSSAFSLSMIVKMVLKKRICQHF